MIDLVRQGEYDRIQVIDNVECMKEILTILEPQALMVKPEGSVDDLEEHLEKLVEKVSDKAMSTVLDGTRNDASHGSDLPQMPDLVEGMSNLNVKLDAVLEFATLQRSDMIQNFRGNEREELSRSCMRSQARAKPLQRIVNVWFV